MNDEQEFAALMAQEGLRPMKGRGDARARPRPRTVDSAPTTDRLQRAEAAIAAAQTAVAGLQHDKGALAAEVERLRSAVAPLEAEIAALQARALQQDAQLASLQNERDEATGKAEQLDAERRALQRKLQAARADTAPAATPAREVLQARGLDTEEERAAAIAGLAQRWTGPLLDALALADPSALSTLLDRRVVLASDAAGDAADERAVVIRVDERRCELGGASDLQRRWLEVVAACERAGVQRMTVVGGSPAYRQQLKQLAKGAPSVRLNLVKGTGRRTARQAASDLRTSDLVVIWGATELDHAISAPYTDGNPAHVHVIAHRGISQMLVQLRDLVAQR